MLHLSFMSGSCNFPYHLSEESIVAVSKLSLAVDSMHPLYNAEFSMLLVFFMICDFSYRI